jgi:hypothetical protein
MLPDDLAGGDWQVAVQPETLPDDASPGSGVVQVADASYTLSVTDAPGTAVTSFDPPLQLSLQPAAASLDTGSNDPTLLSADTLEGADDGITAQSAPVNADGTLTVAFSELQPAAAAEGPDPS